MAENFGNDFDFKDDFAHANKQNCEEDNDYATKGVSFNNAPLPETQAYSPTYGANSEDNVPIIATRGNYLTGIIGAIFGGAIGAMAWIFARQFGNIVFITPVIIAMLTFGGFSLLCSKKGFGSVLSCTAVSVIALVAADFISLVLMLSAMFSQFGLGWTDIVSQIPYLFTMPELANPLLMELAIAIGIMAVAIILIGVLTGSKSKKAAARKMSDGTSTVEFDEMPLQDYERNGDEAPNKFN